jgi:hypothetical protein
LLGIKVIKLNKIIGTQTIGDQIARRSNPGASFLFRSKLPATGSNLKLSNLPPPRRQLPNRQKSRSNPSPKNRRALDA